MSALSIQPTYPIFTDIDGQPLEDGYVWIGAANLDPQTNPINVYWDAALTLPAAQPIRTLAGYPANSGTPARLYVNSDYSIRVMNKNGSSVYSAPAATERYDGELVSFIASGTGAVSTNVQTKLRQFPAASDYATFTDYVNAAVTNNWYVEYGGVIQRFTDRVFMGDAAKNNGRNEAIQADWLTTFQQSTGRPYGFLQTAQGGMLQGGANIAQNAFVVGSQTATLLDNYNAVGLVGVGVSNKTTGIGYGYAAYLEAYRMPSTTGGAYGIEVDTVNYAALTGIDPYFQTPGQTIGVQIASGAELSPVGQFDSTAAINIRDNGSKFFRGLVFGATSLTGSDGVTGLAESITLAKGHTIQWWGAAGVATSSIYCEATTAAGGLRMRFSDNQLQLREASGGKIVYQMFAPAGSVNYVSNRSSVTGAAVQVLAEGDDTNIDLQLLGKGLGTLSFGTYTAGVVAQAGYITVKDSGGTVRRLLVG
jgi:hypothetical protein